MDEDLKSFKSIKHMGELKLFFFFFFLFVVNNYDKCLSYRLNSAAATTTCPWYTCSSDASFIIRYPFYEINNISPLDDYCGYRQFGFSCSPTTNQTMFSLGDELYVVKDINYTDSTLTLVDAAVDLLPPSDLTCHRAKHNTTVSDSLPLQFSSSNLNLTFFFNCSERPSDDISLSDIPCLANDEYHTSSYSYVGLSENVSDSFDDWWKVCQDKVEVPVMEDKINVSDLVGGFGVAMKQGFMLNWRAQENCNSCEENGGNCGFSYTRNNPLCYCKKGYGNTSFTYCKRPSSTRIGLILGFAVPFVVIIVGSMIFCYFRRESIGRVFMKTSYSDDRNLDEFMRHCGSLAPKQYNYSDVKRITNSFATKLGQGGYGCVYRGKLSDGRPVAVKILNESKGNNNGQDFLNEVASISRTSHVNVVSLLGFCYKGTKRALIYEFMSNISLDKFIYPEKASPNTNIELDRTALLKISVGVARGLEYLHSGCNTRILHLDIKPHNILLDEDWCPKISDFGLAKLCQRKDSMISTMGARGTIGYIAPEVFSRAFGRVSYKSDVYSYGMMILEMAGVGKSAKTEGVTETSEMYFPNWIYKKLEAAPDGMALRDNEVERKMILVGLWCIQTKPADRPSMTKVIEMLEGSTDLLQTPPKPFLFSPTSRSLPITYSSSSLSSMSQIIDIQS